MLKIVLTGDNHGDMKSIARILQENPDADYYIHTGDSCVSPQAIEPFISVKGNNDYNDFPKERILEIGNHKILLIHGQYYTYSLSELADKAKQEGCDSVFFGHTHQFAYKKVNDIIMINPGSTYYNRDFSNNCYAIVYIEDDDSYRVIKKELI